MKNIDTNLSSSGNKDVCDETSLEHVDATLLSAKRSLKSTQNYSQKRRISKKESIQQESSISDSSETCPSQKELDLSFICMSSDEKVQRFMLEGGMIDHDSVEYDLADVDRIVNDTRIGDVRLYLVRWKKWSAEHCTWETFGSLRKCQKIIFNYFTYKKKNLKNWQPTCIRHPMLSKKILTYLFSLYRSPNGLSLPELNSEDVSNLYKSYVMSSQKSKVAYKKSLQNSIALLALKRYRRAQTNALKYWEVEINAVVRDYTIQVENNIDLEGPPDSFAYTNKYIPGDGVIIPNDPPIGCACKKNCLSSDECCNQLAGRDSGVYNADKTIKVSVGTPIYECNKKCKCSSECSNRVVQLGSKVNVCIYKTKKCGWGVKASQNIKRGQFVGEFIGEVITVEESEDRLEKNFSVTDYMWNLDFDDSYNYKYLIDCTHYANFTYFINHSCDPNLNVYAVWINCLETNLPQLALFANRNIAAGERLTTNYFYRCNSDTLKKSGTKCQCEMKNCKNYFF